jgi:hypothetical protein
MEFAQILLPPAFAQDRPQTSIAAATLVFSYFSPAQFPRGLIHVID